MFMEYETWVDKVCAGILLVGGLALVIWWMGFVIPERDRKLWQINACYVERGCDEINGTPQDTESARQCWSECTQNMRDADEGVALNMKER